MGIGSILLIPYLISEGIPAKETFLGYLTGSDPGPGSIRAGSLADDVDRMYRARDPGYMRLMGDFADRFPRTTTPHRHVHL